MHKTVNADFDLTNFDSQDFDFDEEMAQKMEIYQSLMGKEDPDSVKQMRQDYLISKIQVNEDDTDEYQFFNTQFNETIDLSEFHS